MAGAATNIANWLSEIFLQVYNNATPLPVESGLNFNPPLVATRNPTSGWIDVNVAAGGGQPFVSPTVATSDSTATTGFHSQVVLYDTTAGGFELDFPPGSSVGDSVTIVGLATTSGYTKGLTVKDPGGLEVQAADSNSANDFSSEVILYSPRNVTWTLLPRTAGPNGWYVTAIAQPLLAQDVISATTGQTVFPMTFVPVNIQAVSMYVNGVLFPQGTDWNYTFPTGITWTNAAFTMTAGFQVVIRYTY